MDKALSWIDIDANTLVTRKMSGLHGEAPSDFRTKLAGGKQITYQKLLRI